MIRSLRKAICLGVIGTGIALEYHLLAEDAHIVLFPISGVICGGIAGRAIRGW